MPRLVPRDMPLWGACRSRRKLPPGAERLRRIALAGTSSAAALASVVLTWEQKSKVKAWCFWCLTSAAINALILPLAIAEVGRPAKKRLSGRS